MSKLTHKVNYRLPSVCSISSHMTSTGILCSSKPAFTLGKITKQSMYLFNHMRK